VRLASVRRSLFTNDAARSKFLAHLMTGTKAILQTGQGIVRLLRLSLFCIVPPNPKNIIFCYCMCKQNTFIPYTIKPSLSHPPPPSLSLTDIDIFI